MDTSKQPSLNLGTSFEPVTLDLPWPPSINNYFMEYAMPPATALIEEQIRNHGFDGFHTWLRRNTRVMKRVGEKGHMYREDVQEYVLRNRLNRGIKVPLVVRGLVNYPDRRERDLDNLYKPMFDALEHSCVFLNDSQIKHHDILVSEEIIKGGKIALTLEELVY